MEDQRYNGLKTEMGCSGAQSQARSSAHDTEDRTRPFRGGNQLPDQGLYLYLIIFQNKTASLLREVLSI